MPIQIPHLEVCIGEAERFLLRAKAALKEHRHELKDCPTREWTIGYGPQNAAVRRSSMDLTRALAQLRKVE
jgi:hypothetical protein